MTSDPTSGHGVRPGRIGPIEIQQKEFRVSRFGGYKMRDVDEFLDELTTAMGLVIAENDGLRSHASASPVVGSPDLDDVGRQADEIIQRARDEAAQIVADARAGAAAASSIAAGTADDRAAVHAFLLQERDFLQGLGALVQGHAESVKTMARAARSSAPPSPPTQVGSEAGSVGDAEAAEDSGSPPAITTGTAPAAEPAEERSSGDPGPTIRIGEPERAAATAERESDGSLRELFWGEED